jgi:hypothetical protein
MRGTRGRMKSSAPGTAVWLPLLSVALGTGCSHQTTLPVQHVAIYRNGVSYIERAGYAGSGDVRFKMKESQVSDFLATVEVTERGGGSVRAAALPVKSDGVEDTKAGLETVALSLDGGGRDIEVGYIAASPVWKPSYRLVLLPGGQADLQVWGLVQNLSGEDWKNVRMSLIAGAPIAYADDLQNPVIPSRPTVTDRGENFDTVPHSETSLEQGPAQGHAEVTGAMIQAQRTSLSQRPSTQAIPTGDVLRAVRPASASTVAGAGAHGSGAAPSYGYKSALDEAMAAAAAPATPSPALQTLLAGPTASPLAAVTMQGGTTRYDLPSPVTIPDESATMLLVMARHVSGEEIFLYAPDPQIPESANRTFRAARFVNGSGGELEGGPVAMFEQGAFLGQALIDALPAGATATMPFALERSIAVEKEVSSADISQEDRLAKIVDGKPVLARDRSTVTTYRMRNGAERPARIFVKHPRVRGSQLASPPAGTEDNVGTGSALVPVTVPPHATSELSVDERVTQLRVVEWSSYQAEHAVKTYLADPTSNRDVVKQLMAAWNLQTGVGDKTLERNHVKQQSYDLQLETEEIRRNLKAVGAGDAVRAKLTARLAEATAEIAVAAKKIVALDAEIAAASDGFGRAIADVHMP